jgi:hypothetical protein
MVPLIQRERLVLSLELEVMLNVLSSLALVVERHV